MDDGTGRLRAIESAKEIRESEILLNESQLTDKQKETMQVSKNDSISELGRMLTGCRKDRRDEAKKLKRGIKHQKEAK